MPGVNPVMPNQKRDRLSRIYASSRAPRKLWYSGLVANYGRRRPVCQTRNDRHGRVISLAIVGNTGKLWILVFHRVEARQS